MGTSPGDAESLWCVGLEGGADSGWPGTDWIEDIVLRQSGPDVYDEWVAGTRTWSSAEIKSAFEAFGDVLDASFGGADTVNSTNFGAAGNPLFTDPPGCLFHHQASFITDFFKEQGGAADGEFDFFPMPDMNPAYEGAFTGAGDLFGMFNDTPQARDLLKYLVTAEAQQIWVSRGGALSGNTTITSYPDDVSARSAEILGSAKIFRFDGGDLMPNAMKSAFFRAMVDFAADQGSLDSILAGLDEVQASAYEQ
jgi:alpha-glucoside transport system substrate-binding protein